MLNKLKKNKNSTMKKVLFAALFTMCLLFASCGVKTAETETVVGDTLTTVIEPDTTLCDTVLTDTVR